MTAAAVATWGVALQWATARLVESRSPTPDLDALSLLMRALGVPHGAILAAPEHPLSLEVAAMFERWIERRAAGEPAAYITGHKAFMGLDLFVDRSVYLPRSDSEALAHVTLEVARLRHEDDRLVAADIGTGSGAIALALASLEPRLIRVYGVDIAPDALAVARRNGARYHMNDRVRWLQGDLLDPLPEPVDLIVANPPCIPEHGRTLDPLITHFEPTLAFYGGDDGLVLVQRLLTQAPEQLRPGGALVLSALPEHRQPIAHLLAAALPGARTWWFGGAEEANSLVVAQLSL
jgi:release factor glutamine methyltransferase